MPVPLSTDQLVGLIKKSNLVEADLLDAFLQEQGRRGAPTPKELAQRLVEEGVLTNFQAEQFLLGKWRGFTLGKFKVLERLGQGGMGSVYLCEHLRMRHKVAVKVLPSVKANDPAALGRFYREARAAASLDHPNLVRAHDVDQEGELHFLVMDYVEGVNLQHLVTRITGPLSPPRACHYVYQAALGLDHAYRAGLVHRDIKPANILVDRLGVVKVLDMGLARFYEDNQDLLTIKYDDNNVLGTADYVSPEQAVNSHDVDIRTDVYSLGATFYFLLTGQPLFPEGKVAQKLIWHQTRHPAPLRQLRPDVPPALEAVVHKMLAKKPDDRYPDPESVIEALGPWVREPIPPPDEDEIPALSPAARMAGSTTSSAVERTPPPSSSRDRRPSAGPATPVRVERPAPVPLSSPSARGAPAAKARPSAELPAPRLAPLEPPRHAPAGKLAPGSRVFRRLVYALVAVVIGASAGVAVRWTINGAPFGKCPRGRLLVVNRSGEPNTFRTVRAALEHAKPGDRIEVREETWEETLRLDEGDALGKEVVIAGAAPAPRGEASGPVTWRAPAGHKEGESLVHLSAVAGLVLENFTLDGGGRVQHLVTLTGPCPDVRLEKLRLQGFRASAVRLTACSGDAQNPVVLQRLHVTPSRQVNTALLLEASPDQACRHVRVADCRLEGPCRAGVVLTGPVAGLELRHNHFVRVGDGVVYRKAMTPHALEATLADNTFLDVPGVAIRFETTPPVEESRVALENNRFTRVGTLARIDDFKPEPARTDAQWVWAAGQPDRPPNCYFRRRFILEGAPSRAVLSVACADSFTVWVNGQQVGKGNTADRVYAFDVARHLQAGANVLAVGASGAGGDAGLLVELNDNATGIFTRTVWTDPNWKASLRPVPGWQDPGFDDKGWPAVLVLAPYGRGPTRWRGLVWDAVVQEHFRFQMKRVFPALSGNVRDAGSREGFPSLKTTVITAAEGGQP